MHIPLFSNHCDMSYVRGSSNKRSLVLFGLGRVPQDHTTVHKQTRCCAFREGSSKTRTCHVRVHASSLNASNLPSHPKSISSQATTNFLLSPSSLHYCQHPHINVYTHALNSPIIFYVVWL